MSEDFDVNKMAAEFASQNLERFYDAGKDVLKGAADKARLHLSRSYRDYLSCVAERHSRAKSFFIRSEPTNLYDFYVPVGISSEKISISKTSMRAISSVNPFAVITGGGGSGKSVLMRHLLLDAVAQKEKVPIFIELRELNQTEQSLIDFIKSTLHSNHFTLDDDYIEKALKAGHFALLFDGFDELTDLLRKEVRKQIFQLTKNYDRNVILVSSRPDNEFSGWAAFNVFTMNELTLDQACELVEKLPFDDELKTKFLSDLRQGLYQRHRSFLSNPLLLSIMLLTYGQSADIPDKLSIFYRQAYEALFQRHDALKAGFQRERLTGLDVQDFGKAFSAFSLLTYDKRIFQMSSTDALDYIESSKKLSGIDFNASKFLKDAEQAVCLLVEDGMQIVFAHRSFQEYFTARYILNAKPEVQEKLVEKYSKNIRSDSVMDLLYEMNAELVERLFIIPGLYNLERLFGIKNKAGITHYLRYLKKLVKSINVRPDGEALFMANDINFFEFISFVEERCGHLVAVPTLPLRKRDNSFWLKYVDKGAIATSSLKSYGDVTRHLAMEGGILSKDGLDLMLQIKEALLKKHQNQKESLDEIISG